MALNCGNINQTYNSYVCDSTTPGIDTIYLMNIAYLSGFTISTGNVITAIVLSGSQKFYEMRPYVETAEANNVSTINEFGASTSLHNIKMNLNGVSTESVQLGYNIFKSGSAAIVKMNSGKYWLFGTVDSATPSLGKGMTAKKFDVINGVKSEDLNAVQLELEAKCNRPAYEVDSTIVTALVNAIT